MCELMIISNHREELLALVVHSETKVNAYKFWSEIIRDLATKTGLSKINLRQTILGLIQTLRS